MKLGRLDLPAPEVWLPGRDEIRLGGLACEPSSHSYEGLVALTEALTGLADNLDEPIVPVVTDEFTGYCAVASIDVDPGDVGMAVGWAEYEAHLIPVEPAHRPQALSALTQTSRANDNGVTTPYAIHAVPAAVQAFTWQPTASAAQEVRLTAPGPAGGDVLYRRAAAGMGQTEARYWTSAKDWYAGGCHVIREVGQVDVPVVGRRTIEQPWRATNGLVEMSLAQNGRLSLRWWMPDGLGWTPPWEFAIGIAGGFHFTGWVAHEVTMLGVQQVTIRAQGLRPAASGGVQGRSTLWLTIKRGSRTVEATIDTDSVPGHRVTPVAPAGSGWSTAVTDEAHNAFLATAPADTNGLHWVFTAADNFGVNTTTGVMTPSDGRLTWSWGIGAYFDSATGDSASRDAVMRDWYAARSEQVQIG